MPQPDGEDRVVVVGAGIAGLSAARAPILLRLPSDAPTGPRLGLAGELFFLGGGASAAWMSGVRLARLVLAEER